jgi:chromate reductase, NAD(P)H dehydrogenase (quinone)
MTASILVFAGSTRAQSHNRKLAHVAAQLAREAGASVTHIELSDFDVPLYNADLESRGTPRDVIRLKELFFSHAGHLIVSPEYNGSYTALLKNTIDWVSSPAKAGGDTRAETAAQWSSGTKPFRGKVVGLLSASPGALGGLRSLEHLAPLVRNLGCWLAPTQFALGRASEAFDAQGQLKDDKQTASMKAVVEQVIHGASRLGA